MSLLTEEYMTPKEASEIIGVHFQTLRKLYRNEEIVIKKKEKYVIVE